MTNVKKSNVILILILCTTAVYAQIRVTSTGQIKVGNEPMSSANDPTNTCTTSMFGLGTDTYRAGSKLSFGDFGTPNNSGANVFLGEWTLGDTDAMQIHGKNGIFFSVYGVGNYDVGKFVGENFFLRGSIFSNAPQYFSDLRLKKNVKTVAGALESLKKLRGITYDWKTEKDEATLNSIKNMKTTQDKDAKDLEKFKDDIEKKIANSTNQIGFGAQEVQLIFPSLVKEDTEGNLSVNYVGIIPILVEGIKEQQNVIDAQKIEIENLKKDIVAIKKKIGM
jgi:Chaperone of endosialidase